MQHRKNIRQYSKYRTAHKPRTKLKWKFIRNKYEEENIINFNEKMQIRGYSDIFWCIKLVQVVTVFDIFGHRSGYKKITIIGFLKK